VAKAKFEVKACANTDFAFVNKFALIVLIKILSLTTFWFFIYERFRRKLKSGEG